MKKKVISMALGALAGLFLAVSPVAAADLPAAGPGDWLRATYQNVLEWFAALNEGAEPELAPYISPTGEPAGVAEPEVTPYTPPGGEPAGIAEPEAAPYIPPTG